MKWKKRKRADSEFATFLTKREECLTGRVRLYITNFSFNPYCPLRSLQLLKTKLTYIFILTLFVAS